MVPNYFLWMIKTDDENGDEKGTKKSNDDE